MPQPRETFNSQELAVVLSNYDLGIVIEVTDFPRGSHASAKAIVRTDRSRFLLKRRPRGGEDPYRVAFSHDLQRFLAEKNFPLPHLIGTRPDNNSMLKIGEALYEVYEFIEGEAYDGGLVATYEAGKTLALYHRLVHEYHPKYEPPRGHYHDAKTIYDAFPQMKQILAQKSELAKGQEQALRDTLEGLRLAYATAANSVNELGMAKWESQIVHSDWHPGNMLFQDRHVVAVLDYDAARVRPRVTDIANGCLQFSMVTHGRDLARWEDRTDVQRAKRFLRGYDEINVISQAELRAVPLLMQEAMIAQSVAPILRTGTFAGLDGFGFLRVILRKIRWLQENAPTLELDTNGES